MSIICEGEENLHKAIWHMERAFEIRPASDVIQGELQRLYGLRDGVEPPKVRLTHGALARMYVKGGLYTQAIAEIRATLAEDQLRLDLLTLLASTYAKDGQQDKAAETAKDLLDKLPFSLEGNRIMAQVMTKTGLEEDDRRQVEEEAPGDVLAEEQEDDHGDVEEAEGHHEEREVHRETQRTEAADHEDPDRDASPASYDRWASFSLLPHGGI